MAAVTEQAKKPSVVGGLPDDEKGASDFSKLNMLLHSFGGVGKTTFLSGAALDERTSPVLVLDCEGNSKIRYADIPKHLYTIRAIRTIDDLNKLYDYLAKGNHPYKSVIIDSITDLQKLGLEEFVYKSGEVINFKSSNIKTAEIQHWGKSLTQMIKIMQAFKALPIHFFCTALTQTIVDESTGAKSYDLSLPGRQKTDLIGIPNIVGYLDIAIKKDTKEKCRICYFQPDGGKVIAKDQTDALGTGIWWPKGDNGITKILNLIDERYSLERAEGE